MASVASLHTDVQRLHNYWYRAYRRGLETVMSFGGRGARRTSDPLRDFRKKYMEDEVVDPSVVEDCKVMVALEWQGYSPYEIDKKLGWPKGKCGSLRCDNPEETKHAENLHLEEAQRRYRQAQAKLYETLANAILPTVIYLSQVVQGGGENITTEFRSNLVREVDPNEATTPLRIKASEVVLKFAQLVYQESKRNGVDKGEPNPLPESFAGKIEAAASKVGNLRLIGGKVGDEKKATSGPRG